MYSYCTTWREHFTKTAPARRWHSVGGGGGGAQFYSVLCMHRWSASGVNWMGSGTCCQTRTAATNCVVSPQLASSWPGPWPRSGLATCSSTSWKAPSLTTTDIGAFTPPIRVRRWSRVSCGPLSSKSRLASASAKRSSSHRPSRCSRNSTILLHLSQ